MKERAPKDDGTRQTEQLAEHIAKFLHENGITDPLVPISVAVGMLMKHIPQVEPEEARASLFVEMIRDVGPVTGGTVVSMGPDDEEEEGTVH